MNLISFRKRCKRQQWVFTQTSRLQNVCPSVYLKWGWKEKYIQQDTRHQPDTTPHHRSPRVIQTQFAHNGHQGAHPGGKPVNPQRPVTDADAPVASMKDSGVLTGSGGGESSLSQQSGLKGQKVKWEAESITGPKEKWRVKAHTLSFENKRKDFF